MIYFVYEPTDNAVKIGYSSRVDLRFDQLQVGNARPLKLLGMIPGEMDREQALHQQFNHLRIRGEWFRYENELRRFIESSVLKESFKPEKDVVENSNQTQINTQPKRKSISYKKMLAKTHDDLDMTALLAGFLVIALFIGIIL